MHVSRLAKLEESLKDEGLSESQKQEKRQQHAQKETEFLRLKRSRLGVEDFEPLKVSFLCELYLSLYSSNFYLQCYIFSNKLFVLLNNNYALNSSLFFGPLLKTNSIFFMIHYII